MCNGGYTVYGEKTVKDIVSRIRNAISEDVEPVIHGYWMRTDEYPHWMCCSVCQKNCT